jgi:peptidoglycan/xylan/chitin deacetylase (PgdA/CDA1 family)
VSRVVRVVIVCLVLAGCQENIADIDAAFYDWSGRSMHCGVDLDTKHDVSLSSIAGGLDRAAARGEVVELYSHHPGVTVPVDTIDFVLSGARARGLDFITYADFADPQQTPRGGLALSFDDTSVDAWFAQRALFQQYGAHVTFFVSRYEDLGPTDLDELHQLAADGHDIEAHSVHHLSGPDDVEQNGLSSYMNDEILPSIDLLEQDGYTVHAFAYPFGLRTSETDRAIGEHVAVLRSSVFTHPDDVSPCPL